MDNLIGRKLDGRYLIESLLGVGGMANVYKGRDVRTGNAIAVKVLKEEFLDNEELVRRFKNESKAISILDHPNIVKVYDVSVTDQLQYIVMEYIDGITLKEYLKQRGGALTWKEVIHFATQVLGALEHAHSKGIVHRDVKPQNIMLQADGSIKMMDFGIARFSRAQSQTVSDKAIGSVHYISPEQACGEESDAKSDIYSVGVLLYEMLSGSVPFDGDTPEEVAMKHIHEKPTPLHQLNPEIPIGLCEICDKAMQKDKNMRYRSAKEMLAAVDAFKANPAIRFHYRYTAAVEPAALDRRQASSEKRPQQPQEPDEEEIIVIKKSPSIMILTGIAAACCIAVLLVLLGFFYWGRDEEVPEISMPNLVGMSYDEVRNTEEYSQFNFIIEERAMTDQYEAGVIYYQNVTAGTQVRANRTIRIKVSDGITTLYVPNLVGQDVSAAEQTLYDMGLDYSIRTQETEDDSIPADQVLSTDPPAGTQIEQNAIITLYISRGSVTAALRVPDVRGRTQEDATARLEAVGLQVSVTEVDSDQAPGIVVEQSIAPNEFVPEDGTITISVSNGSDYQKTVPLQISFPSDANDAEYTMVLYMDGIDIGSLTINPSSGSVSLNVNGQGQQEVIVSLDGQQYASYTIDFDAGTATLNGSYNTSIVTGEISGPGDSSDPISPGDPGTDGGGESATNPGPGDSSSPSSPSDGVSEEDGPAGPWDEGIQPNS